MELITPIGSNRSSFSLFKSCSTIFQDSSPATVAGEVSFQNDKRLVCYIVPGQRIVTIQLDGTQYYVSKMNPYASELNYFLAYQYCRSIGLQLVSFETREKADSIAEYLKNAGT